MEIHKNQESSKTKPNMKNIYPNKIQEKIIRSKSKNMYPQKNVYKSKNSNKFIIPQPLVNNENNIINNCHLEKIEMSSNKKFNFKNNETKSKQSYLIELKKLTEENTKLQKTLIGQEKVLKDLHDIFIHNYNKINSLKKNIRNISII